VVQISSVASSISSVSRCCTSFQLYQLYQDHMTVQAYLPASYCSFRLLYSQPPVPKVSTMQRGNTKQQVAAAAALQTVLAVGTAGAIQAGYGWRSSTDTRLACEALLRRWSVSVGHTIAIPSQPKQGTQDNLNNFSCAEPVALSFANILTLSRHQAKATVLFRHCLVACSLRSATWHLLLKADSSQQHGRQLAQALSDRYANR
jgi:hypothetical protein